MSFHQTPHAVVEPGWLDADDSRTTLRPWTKCLLRHFRNRTGGDEGAVSPVLLRLKARNFLEHEATYWAATDEEPPRFGCGDAIYGDDLSKNEKWPVPGP